MNEADWRKKEVTQGTITIKNLKNLPDEAISSSLGAAPASALRVDYGLAARKTLQKVQQELVTKEVELWVRSELENTDLRKKLDTLEKTVKEEDNQEPKTKLNVISGKTFVMTRDGSKIMSINWVAGHQVVKSLSEPSEITMVHLDIYADYLRAKEPKLVARVVRAVLLTGGPRLMRVDGHYIEVYGPYPIFMSVDDIKIYAKAHLTNANDQEELKVRRIPCLNKMRP